MQLDKRRTAIVFIEFQKEWLQPDGILRELLIEDEADFLNAVNHARRILTVARKNGWRVVHAGLDMRNDPDYMLFNRGQGVAGLRGAIPKAGTWTGDGAEFVPPFLPGPDEYVVQGRSGASVLKNSTLDPYLRNAGVDTLVLLGFALHVCVESSLREAHDLGYNVIVPSDASGVFVPEQRTYFDKHVVHHFGKPMGTQKLLEKLGG
ncbi:MAG: cysteine hydrolase [Desulfococcaceae bacterium]